MLWFTPVSVPAATDLWSHKAESTWAGSGVRMIDGIVIDSLGELELDRRGPLVAQMITYL